MSKIDNNGWLIKPNKKYKFRYEDTGVSSNFNKRPNNIKIDLVVLHCISLPEGEYRGEGIDRLFLNKLDKNLDHKYYENLKDLKVSSHVVIFRDGSLKQYVSFLDSAWHAGESEYKGRFDCNDFSIGIELEGCVGDKNGYTDNQYFSLKNLLEDLKSNFDFEITTHKDIAPDRKDDPGEYFDFQRLNTQNRNISHT